MPLHPRARGLDGRGAAQDGVAIRWVQSAGSNKALEFLNAGSLDFGSTAGAVIVLLVWHAFTRSRRRGISGLGRRVIN